MNHYHPCKLPRKWWWNHGKSWTCTCGTSYWLLCFYYYSTGSAVKDWTWVEGSLNIKEN